MKHLFAAFLFIAPQLTSKVHAQNVDIQLRNTGATLEVWLIPKANYTGSVTSLTFTISWNTAYNVDLAPAGTETNHVSAIPIQVSGNATQTSIVNGSKTYRVYASGGGASTIALTNNAALKILSVPVPRTGATPTGAFSINNDAYTTANNYDYYFEMSSGVYTGNTTSIATNVPIPLELVAFEAVEKDNSAYLTWRTASEINFSHFDVERSTDTRNWTTISTLKGGNTEGAYFLTDDKAFTQNNVVLYRLKMVDTDGSVKYSAVKSVAQQQRTGDLSRPKLYPNPVVNSFELVVESDKNAIQMLEIVDITGKIQRQTTLNLSKGTNQQTVDVLALPSGAYFLNIKDSKGMNQTLKWVKL